MREILFRGKRSGIIDHENDGKWIEGGYFEINGQGLIMTADHRCLAVDPSTVGQYTGLTDKTGKKIFEGDIIKIVPDYDYSDDYSISKVYSYNVIFCVDYHGDDFDSTALGFLEDYLPEGGFEVIGNIHDNPELLKGADT